MRKIEWLILLAVAIIAIVGNLQFKSYMDQRRQGSSDEDKTILSMANEKDTEAQDEPKVPDSLNVLVVGLDKSKSLADINMIAHLDTETNTVKLISIPRDLYIDFREPDFATVKENHPKIKSNFSKLTEVYGRAGGKDDGLQAIKEVVEIVTNLEIDNVVSVDTNGFVNIVDAVGGVEYDVPQKMFYEDPYQNLYINLEAGLQLLDGDKAEQLVRFRKYKGDTPPDIQRIQVQQDFLRVLSEKILSTRNVGQITKLATTCFGMVNTDMSLFKMIEYVEYVMNQGVSQLIASKDMGVVPTYSEKSTVTGQWFEMWDSQAVNQYISDFMTATPLSEELQSSQENASLSE